jgi:hypothetical protein
VFIPLTRYVLIDIDDIFVGSARLTQKDVTALVESQQRLATLVKGLYFLANRTIYLWLGSSVVERTIFL